MSNLINFDFQSQTVRVELKNGEPLFCLTDVATILEISNANPSRFNLSDDGVHKMYSVDSKGRKNEITFINEPNLYRVIFRSNKAEAVKFQNWVFDEVLPSIRKTGQYRHTISIEQQAAIQKCVRQKCLHNSTHFLDDIHSDAIARNLHNLVWHTMHIYQWYKERENAFFALSPTIAGGVHDHIIHAKGCANALQRAMSSDDYSKRLI